VPVVDNVVRAIPNVTAHARDLADADRGTLRSTVESFDAAAALADAERAIREGGEVGGPGRGGPADDAA
jgi:4-phosphopantoate--beta-alanine ligase